MGTSTSNRGQNGKTPLVPSWLDEGQNSEPQENPAQVDPKRFSAPRSNFTRYVNSEGGGSGNLRRAASGYVRQSLGGSKNATARLGAAKASTARLVSVLGGFASQGISETSKNYHLGELVGKNAKEVFLRLLDYVCPDGGNTDEGIARNAYIEALSTLSDWENKPIESLTPAEFLAFTEIYMANVIEERLVNDIGSKLFSLPKDVSTIENLQSQLKDYIRGAVTDAIAKLNVEMKNINTLQTRRIVDAVYHETYNILAGMEE